MGDSGVGVDAQALFLERMAKAMADPLRIKILVELNKRAMSPSQFYEECGEGSVARVWRHFRKLEEFDWLEKVEEKSGGKRRGATEHFYRATRPAMFDEQIWPTLPESMKETVTGETFETFSQRVTEAMEAGTIDARDDRHLTWIAILLDRAGWDNVIARFDSLFRFVLDEQAEASLRMAKSGETPIPATVALAAFESPMDSTRAP